MDWQIFNIRLKELMDTGNILRNEEDLEVFINHPEATVEALEAFMKVLEVEEKYEWCAIVKQKVKKIKANG